MGRFPYAGRRRATRAAASFGCAAALALALAPIAFLASPAAAQGPAVQTGVPYGSGPMQTMDVYLPSGSGPFPALVLIHGGVFVKGDSSSMQAAAEQAVSHGYAAFSLNYRLAPQNPFPAGFDDVKAAVVFIRQHASQFHVDPVRVGGIGGSAGANLLAMLATAGSGPPVGSRLVAAVLWSCPCDLHAFAHPVADYIGPNATDTQIQAASPAFQVDPTDAPLLIANGTNEGIPFPQAQEMAAAYQRNGIPYQLLHAPQQAHSEHLGQFIYPQTFAFLDRYVKGYRPGSPPPSISPSASVPPVTPDPGSPGGSGTPAGCAFLLLRHRPTAGR